MSPASAWALRSWSLSPARSISAAIWRPFSVCRGRQLKFFSQRLGQLRRPDHDALDALDLGDKPRDRPVPPVGDGRFQQRHADPERGLGFDRWRACIHARLHGLDAPTGEVATPEANRVFAHAEHFGDPRAGPALERQQDGASPISLATILRRRQRLQRRPLLIIRRHRRFASHVHPRESVRRRDHSRDSLVNRRISA